METNSVQQEILLVKNTSFAHRQLFEHDDTFKNERNLPHGDWLEAACWNGWLDAMLPEIVDTSSTGKSLYLWQIMQAKSFLSIELCEYPHAIDVQYSINPYAIVATMCNE